MKRVLVGTAAIGAAVAVLLYLSSPPGRIILRGAVGDGSITGVIHVHTNRSDGRGSPDEVAAAAARARLKFVVFTDHGDGTRAPDPPTYRSGVLCIDGVEISTTAGHYIALDVPASPYPLGGEPRDVVEDVERLGGFGIAAHPDSPKADLQWGDWDAPIDGMEILNLDTGWRVRALEPGIGPKLHLLGALGTYPFVPGETIVGLLNDPTAIIDRWVSLGARRRVVGMAGVDAHAKLALWDLEPGDNRFALPVPGYEAAFRALSVNVIPDRPLSGDASADGATVLRALRGGHLYTAIDAVATPPSFEFSATSLGETVQQGGELPPDGPVRLRVRSNAPPGFTATVWEGDRVLATGRRDPEFTILVPQGPGVYRVEIRASSRPAEPLWIISNPIYVGISGGAVAPPPAVEGADAAAGPVLFPADAFGWTVEHDPASRADLEVDGGAMRLRFALGSDPATRPRVATAAPPVPLTPNQRVLLTMSGDRPMRVSVQLRTGIDGTREERWQRSVYVDTVERVIPVRFDDMKPVGDARSARPPLGETPSLVLVIDTTNTRPGASGELRVGRVALDRPAAAPEAPAGPPTGSNGGERGVVPGPGKRR